MKKSILHGVEVIVHAAYDAPGVMWVAGLQVRAVEEFLGPLGMTCQRSHKALSWIDEGQMVCDQS